eukprot:CAMPEP_0170386830 /NCGR_PEP_ID=MMETSP0117_2-20130122/17241_1 /TAXON_ID=400756 /ORGANISM="Durinskia baltica, Strain CSIRO CS-38" /LENGTH=95 /DNA_ID=CAMNT_0010642673 /DNA_START=18 /DNA_END=301 /DNA_ORIENTATION=+
MSVHIAEVMQIFFCIVYWHPGDAHASPDFVPYLGDGLAALDRFGHGTRRQVNLAGEAAAEERARGARLDVGKHGLERRCPFCGDHRGVHHLLDAL